MSAQFTIPRQLGGGIRMKTANVSLSLVKSVDNSMIRTMLARCLEELCRDLERILGCGSFPVRPRIKHDRCVGSRCVSTHCSAGIDVAMSAEPSDEEKANIMASLENCCITLEMILELPSSSICSSVSVSSGFTISKIDPDAWLEKFGYPRNPAGRKCTIRTNEAEVGIETVILGAFACASSTPGRPETGIELIIEPRDHNGRTFGTLVCTVSPTTTKPDWYAFATSAGPWSDPTLVPVSISISTED